MVLSLLNGAFQQIHEASLKMHSYNNHINTGWTNIYYYAI